MPEKDADAMSYRWHMSRRREETRDSRRYESQEDR